MSPHTHAARPINESIISCSSCRLVLAGISAGLIIVRRDRTEIVCEKIHSIRCHRCGENNSVAPVGPVASVTSSFATPTITSQPAYV